MDDPIMGLEKLLKNLNNGGIINLGLYSRLARKKINLFRNSLKNNHVNMNDNDIINYRLGNNNHLFYSFFRNWHMGIKVC